MSRSFRSRINGFATFIAASSQGSRSVWSYNFDVRLKADTLVTLDTTIVFTHANGEVRTLPVRIEPKMKAVTTAGPYNASP